MAAPQIPNLLSLRGKPRSRRLDRKGDPVSCSFASQQRRDLDIQGTDTDAAVSRMSAVSLEYLNDIYAPLFVKGPLIRRLPIINRGTYTRTFALDTLIDSFLSSGECRKQKQIISLGAGTDTRYFRLRDSKKYKSVIYHEFDFPEVSLKKKRIILSHPKLLGNSDVEYLWSATEPVDKDSEFKDWGFVRRGGNTEEIVYCFHPIDLRQIARTGNIQSFLGLRADVPTLILSECCLCYMDVIDSSNIIKWFTEKISSIGIILYEPIGSNDSFGQMMISNLAARNIVMPSISHYKTLSDQCKRLSEFGFNITDSKSGCKAKDINATWEDWVPAAEKERVNCLEGLDEVEEWQMLAKHYAVVWGWRSVGDEWHNWTKL
ncbi:Leucine carboxyl methyltransferase 1 [Erysiphe neolycopersici]|uniref:Leucine carboxyl methyltransferase 1 n=1 Tax=Erysiphe neolycopersici TaxID=212602 RepID=A0A420HIH2_9PEZI|nr:Leucine carboxyl methyltransferase 1 [Erysiphe neolycopersici]